MAETRGRPEYVRPPRQTRSRETLERILDATEELLANEPFEEVSVSDIVRRAASSIGSFYGRFRDKEALLLTLQERLADDELARFRVALAPERWTAGSLEKLLAEFIEFLVRVYRERQGLVRALVVRAVTNAKVRERWGTARREVVEHLRRLLQAHRREFAHPRADLAAEFVLELCLALLQHRALVGDDPRIAQPLADAELAAELRQACLGYLGAG